MGGVQTNNIIKAKNSFSEVQSLHPDSEFHSEGYLPESLELDLENLDLHQDENRKKHYFEISTNVDNISNQKQKMVLLKILGEDDIFEKLQLLYKAGRKYIRCFF